MTVPSRIQAMTVINSINKDCSELHTKSRGIILPLLRLSIKSN